MELVVQLLMVLVALSLFFQMSQWSWLPRLITGLLLFTVAYGSYSWIINQSREQLNLWFDDTNMMQNLAVVQMIEAILFITIDLTLLKKHFGKPIRKYVAYASYFPGIMLIAAMLYAQMTFFYSFSQIDFDQLGLYFALGIGALVFLVPLVLQWIIPEHYLRMELRYIICFGQMLSTIIITVFCQVLPYGQQSDQFEINPLLVIIGLFVLMFLVGWSWSLIKNKITFKWKF